MTADLSLQELYAPRATCFGCGPANSSGLKIKSHESADGSVIASWSAKPHHEAFSGCLNGGVISTLLDCHCNWAAIAHALRADPAAEPPCTVTAKLAIEFHAPTPTRAPINLTAQVKEASDRKFAVQGSIEAEGITTATCTALFIAVEQGHPAWHRWSK